MAEYHTEISHILIENEEWWTKEFEKCGWHIVEEFEHCSGLKDNWYYCKNGNHVFVLEHQ